MRDSVHKGGDEGGAETVGRRGWVFALTRGGVAYLGAMAFVLVAMVSSGANLLYFTFGVMAGLFVISAFVSSWSLGGIEIQREFGDHIIAGEPADVVYRLTSRKRYWPTMALHFQEASGELSENPRGFVMHLAAGGEGGGSAPPARIVAQLIARRRGVVKLKEIEVSTTFPLGLMRRRRRVRAQQEIVVYPRIGMLNRRLALEYRESIESGAMTSNRRGGVDDFYGIREYRAGDNVRAIHWRLTARTGDVMIREMSANAPPQLIVVLNLRNWREDAGGREAAERAIELAAALVCYGFFENFAVALVIAGLKEEMAPVPRMGRDARARALADLAVLDVEGIGENGSVAFPNRLMGRAEWVIVTLHGRDEVGDLLPPGASARAGAGEGIGFGGGMGHRTVLALDAAGAGEWVQNLSAAETLKILRDRGVAGEGG